MSSLPPLVAPAAELTPTEVARYSRHLTLPQLGMLGQRRLKNARVLVIGAGGLGSPALLYLAAAGVGTIGIVEFDVVDESNLQRQIIHGQADVGRAPHEQPRHHVHDRARARLLCAAAGGRPGARIGLPVPLNPTPPPTEPPCRSPSSFASACAS